MEDVGDSATADHPPQFPFVEEDAVGRERRKKSGQGYRQTVLVVQRVILRVKFAAPEVHPRITALVAQWIEHPPPKGRVTRSIRVEGTRLFALPHGHPAAPSTAKAE